MRSAPVLACVALATGMLLACGSATDCLAQTPPDAQTQGISILTNADVVQMVKSGLSDQVVIAVIQKARTRFDLSAAALAELRSADVSDAVVVAMFASAGTSPGVPATPAAPTPVPPPPTVAPATPRVVAPPPPAAPEPDLNAEPVRGGALFGLSVGGHYAFETDEGDTEDRFGISLGLQAGGHVGKRAAILADVHASIWPATDDFDTGAMFTLGPAVRFFPAPRLSLELGISFALGLSDFDSDPWLGPAGHFGLGVGLTSEEKKFAIELLGRFDAAYLYEYDCSGCDGSFLGRLTGQIGFTWY